MDFVRDLTAGLQRRAPKVGVDRPDTLRRFLEEDIAVDSGERWGLKDHEALGEIVSLISRVINRKESDTQISVLAAEQIGKTLIAVGAALHLVGDHGRNVGYFLPTKNFAHNFGRTRLKRIISNSAFLRDQMKDSEAVNQASLKEMNGHFLYVLGLESMLGAISIPLDVLINDEVDLLPAENLEWSQGRVAHSDLRVTLDVSAGYAPGAGIDLRYQEGTQHKYLFDCPNRRCRAKAICLEESFPACMAKVRGKWERVCPECGEVLDLAKGVWVATHPERAKQKRYSFRISSLIIAARSADHIMKRWEKAKRKKTQKAKFNCAELAMPDAGAMQPITDAELRQMEARDVVLRISQSGRPRFAGVDAGDLYHFVCYERVDDRPRLVWIEEIDSDYAVERISTLIGALGIVSLVPDKKPHTNVVRALAYRFPEIVALQDFKDGSTLEVVEEEHQGKRYRCVKVDRDESLDEMTEEISSACGLQIPDEELLPRDLVEPMTNFRDHLKALRKERTIDRKGRAIHKYLRGVENHFGMALNSARLAELIRPKTMPFRFRPVERESRGFGRGSLRNLKRSLTSGY